MALVQPPTFLRLPPEIRLKVYRILLLRNTSIQIRPRLRVPHRADVPSSSLPPGQIDFAIPGLIEVEIEGIITRNPLSVRLLRSCKQIWQEASDVLYGENVYAFPGGLLEIYESLECLQFCPTMKKTIQKMRLNPNFFAPYMNPYDQTPLTALRESGPIHEIPVMGNIYQLLRHFPRLRSFVLVFNLDGSPPHGMEALKRLCYQQYRSHGKACLQDIKIIITIKADHNLRQKMQSLATFFRTPERLATWTCRYSEEGCFVVSFRLFPRP